MTLNFPHFLHGGDYNPDQWLDCPEILERDVELMKEAHINCASIGIFSWARLEPSEGVFELDWLEKIVNRLYENGVYTILATPSGARPIWMAERYPEVLRVTSSLTRNHFGGRHNHCYTSPLYREKVRIIDTKLAERFSHNPAVLMWHLSNEMSGDCFCPHCRAAFTEWLKKKYSTIENLNKAWWTDFWSHRYSDWSQVEPPISGGETGVHGLNLDWKRFVSHQTAEFARFERDVVKAVNPNLPVTTNCGESYTDVDYYKYKDIIDVASWDSYPRWGKDADETRTGQRTAFTHDFFRSMKQQPFILMESAPSATNWQEVSRLKRPGIHMLASMQAAAHGSNSVLYFQWRQSRGSSEKLHSAVVDHYGKSDTRVFGEVTEVGKRLEGLDEVLTACKQPETAILYDWENGWAMNDAQGPRNCGMGYSDAVFSHHQAFWKLGISTDIIDMDCCLDGYRLVVAPMLYMLRGGIADKLKRFAENGGTVVGTYWSGIVNDSDLCYQGGMPGDGLTELFGLRSEEIDGLYDGQVNRLIPTDGFLPKSEYKLSELCELVKCSGARTLAVYGDDFYKGYPAVTVNEYGKGQAYYIAARGEQAFSDDFIEKVASDMKLHRALDGGLSDGVTATERIGKRSFVFVQNFMNEERQVPLNRAYRDFESGERVEELTLPPFGVRILCD